MQCFSKSHLEYEAAQIIEEVTGIHRKLTQVREFLKRIGLRYRKTASIPAKVVQKDLAKQQDQFVEETLMPLHFQSFTNAKISTV